MSYSFSAKGVTKDAAKDAAAAEFDKVVESQPVHAADRDAALATVGAMIDAVVDPAEGEEVRVSVSGYLSWRTEGEFITASVSAQAGVVAKDPA